MDPANPVGEALNTRPKYVASTTLRDPRWAHTTVLSGDLGALIRWLLEHRLVDEIVLLIYPVIVGQGTRLFPSIGTDIALELVDSRCTPKGLTINTYRTTGRPDYEAFST
jgi:dihydrofolate reductase